MTDAKAAAAQAAEEAEALDLPQTATGYAEMIGQGGLLLLLGVVGLALTRRPRTATVTA